MKNLQSFKARQYMFLVIGLGLVLCEMRAARTSAAAPLQSGPPSCPISCQAPNGANRTIIEWAGRITAITGYFTYTAPEPTFTYRLGYTGSVGPVQIEDQRGKFYRFVIGGVESLAWCYNYTGVQLSQFSDPFGPAGSGSVDLFVDDFVSRKLEYIIYNMVGQVGYENKVLYSSPISNIFLPATPSLPDQTLLDPAKWGNITYQLSTGFTGTTLSGIPNISNGIFSTCPGTSNLRVAMSSAAPNPTNAAPIPVTAQFSENVDGFAASDIIAGNATIGNFVAVDGDTYTFDLIPNGPGVVTADIPAGAAQNGGGTLNIAAERFSRSFSIAGCDFSCQAANGGTMTKIEWTGGINRVTGDAFIVDPQPTFSFRLGYTGWIGPTKIDFGGSKFYRFTIGAGGNENLTWCYSYRGVQFTTFNDSFPPATAMTIDVYVDNFENRRLLNIQYYAVSASATNIIDYVSPSGMTFLPETPTLPDQILLDPAKWGGIGYTLVTTTDGTTLSGIPTTAKGVFTMSVCPGASAPTVAMNSAAPNPTGAAPIPVIAQFSENVAGFTASDLMVVNATVGNFIAVDGDTYTFDLTPLAPGAVTANIPADAAQSVSSNLGNTAAPQFSRDFVNLNNPPAISGATISRRQGDQASSSQIATVGDVNQGAGTLAISINGNTSAIINGVTVSNLINNNGAVSADVVAACSATTATFTLRVTDSNGDFAETTLTVNVSPNPAPTLGYGDQTITLGSTPSFNPAAGPADNVGVGSIIVLSVMPATGLGLAVNNTSGVVTVTGATMPGSYAVVIRAADQCNALTDASFTINVACPTITLSPSSLPGPLLNKPYPQAITAAPAGMTYTYAVTGGALPAGLALNSDGTFSGAASQTGMFNFRITATGPGNCTGSRNYAIVVGCPAITIDQPGLPGGTLGSTYAASVSASPSGGYNYTVIGGTLPGGLTLNSSTGAISGTPTAMGTFNFIIKATSGTCSGSRSFTVSIACPALSFTPSTLPAGEVGGAYNQTLSVTPAGTYNYSLIAGSLPNGLTLNVMTGTISGTPTMVGTYSFTIKAQSSGGCGKTQSYTIVINCPAITVNPGSLPEATRGAAYRQTFSAAPAITNYTYSVSSGMLPPGLSLNATTGVLSGTPTANGTYNIRITARGFGNCTGFRDYSLIVRNPQT